VQDRLRNIEDIQGQQVAGRRRIAVAQEGTDPRAAERVAVCLGDEQVTEQDHAEIQAQHEVLVGRRQADAVIQGDVIQDPGARASLLPREAFELSNGDGQRTRKMKAHWRQQEQDVAPGMRGYAAQRRTRVRVAAEQALRDDVQDRAVGQRFEPPVGEHDPARGRQVDHAERREDHERQGHDEPGAVNDPGIAAHHARAEVHGLPRTARAQLGGDRFKVHDDPSTRSTGWSATTARRRPRT
jgi:hypothetical protein